MTIITRVRTTKAVAPRPTAIQVIALVPSLEPPPTSNGLFSYSNYTLKTLHNYVSLYHSTETQLILGSKGQTVKVTG